MQNQQVLITVILMLVIVIGIFVYDRHYNHPETLGEKVGQTIDHATGANK